MPLVQALTLVLAVSQALTLPQLVQIKPVHQFVMLANIIIQQQAVAKPVWQIAIFVAPLIIVTIVRLAMFGQMILNNAYNNVLITNIGM